MPSPPPLSHSPAHSAACSAALLSSLGSLGSSYPGPGKMLNSMSGAETGSVGSGGSGALPPGLGGQPGSYPHPGQQLTLNGGSSQNLAELQQKVSSYLFPLIIIFKT